MEETGIQASEFDVDENFRFEEVSSLFYLDRSRALSALDLLSKVRAVWRRNSEEDTGHISRPTAIGLGSSKNNPLSQQVNRLVDRSISLNILVFNGSVGLHHQHRFKRRRSIHY